MEETSWNITVPVGVSEEDEATVATNAIGMPAVAGLAEEANSVVVVASVTGSTVTFTVPEVLLANALLPP